jgi:hypothetical protein
MKCIDPENDHRSRDFRSLCLQLSRHRACDLSVGMDRQDQANSRITASTARLSPFLA